MMPSPDLDAGPVPTPCTGVCQIDTQSRLCSGCWRLIEEIAQWSTASESDKRTIWHAIQRRRQDAGMC